MDCCETGLDEWDVGKLGEVPRSNQLDDPFKVYVGFIYRRAYYYPFCCSFLNRRCHPH